MKQSYSEKLRDPRWFRFRQDFLDSISKHTEYGWRAECESCGSDSTPKTLHVHHKRYIDGHEPWEYQFSDLRALCRDCHSTIHEVETKIRRFVISLTVSECETLDTLLDELIASKRQDNLSQAICYAKNEVRDLYWAIEHQKNDPSGVAILSMEDLAMRYLAKRGL